MSNIPSELKYAKSHEWVKRLSDGHLLIGITDHAQNALGDLVFVETPKVGRQVGANEACAVVESVKAASDVYAPVAGVVVAVNAEVTDTPEKVNQDAYAAWMFKIKPVNPADLDGLLDAAAYQALVESEAH